ncbi:MAG: Fic family protein [Betaproteobacteria bacterium]|nr:Fic family protein [Betaproteobacteria bacterium]
MAKKSHDNLPMFVCTRHYGKDRIYRNSKSGRLRRIAAGLYTSIIDEPAEALVQKYLWQIVATCFPQALICDRTALENAPAADGSVCLSAATNRQIILPGDIVLRCRKGAAAQDNDLPFIGGLRMAATARACLENMTPTRSRAGRLGRTLTRDQMRNWLAGFIARRGRTQTQGLLAEAQAIAEQLALTDQARQLTQLIEPMIADAATRQVPAAGTMAMPADAHRVLLFAKLYRQLRNQAPPARKAAAGDQSERNRAFFEAYFSNFIEGTEFSVQQAAAITFDNRIPAGRSKDAHDILGTWAVVSDAAGMQRRPENFRQFVQLICQHHARIMQQRPECAPGQFKDAANQAGATIFVAAEQVLPTLKAGYETCRGLENAFERAVFMKFLIAEVHPFADGNGRLARIMMNAELAAAGEERIIIPTVYRDNYLAALAALSHNRRAEPLIKVLDFAQRWVASIAWHDWQLANRQIAQSNALVDSNQGRQQNLRLTIAGNR